MEASYLQRKNLRRRQATRPVPSPARKTGERYETSHSDSGRSDGTRHLNRALRNLRSAHPSNTFCIRKSCAQNPAGGLSSLRIRNLLRYTFLMRSRASRIAATLALLTCLVCPLVETFDNWDHSMQTGNDTEYGLVVLALCVGVGYSFAHFIFRSASLGFAAKSVFAHCFLKSFLSTASSFTFLLFDATSPPSLPLRI